ncbi:hypothetical protein ES702_06540 [subsurface metagenome]
MALLVKTETAILHTLLRVQEKYRRTYSFIRLKTICKHLLKYYNIRISISDVSYHLGKFYQSDILKYWQRARQRDDGTWHLLPSNRQITGKGILFLKRSGIKVSNMLYNWAFKGIKPKLYKGIRDLPNDPTTINLPSRRAAGTPESIGSVLADFQNSFK